ncbi:MAG: HEAT repeat domain-containing protein [Candidatus Sumerlaeota bacterium]|nr:HEAT repeat domain-containing protein [Candidatus Sumerlaeota bacterium]
MKSFLGAAFIFLALAICPRAADQKPARAGGAKPAPAASGALPMPGGPGAPIAASQAATKAAPVDSSPQHIQELISQFPGEEMGERVRALHAETELIRIGKPAVPALIEATKSKDSWTRVWAGGALGEIGDPRGKPALLALADDPFPTMRCVAAWHLRRWIKDTDVEKKISALLDDPNKEAREWAFKAMDGAKSPQLPARMKEIARSSDTLKRAEALIALRTLIPKAEYLALLKKYVAEDSDPAVHKQAFDLLQQEAPEAELTQILVAEAEQGKDTETRRDVVAKLKQRLSPEAYSKLMLGRLEKDSDYKIRIMALQDLYKQKEMKNSIIPILIGWFEKQPEEWSASQKDQVLKIAGKMLDMLTGQPFSSNPPPRDETPAQTAARWNEWWKKQPK